MTSGAPASVRTFDVVERRARLAVRHCLAPGHRAPDVRAATNRMVCLHATDPATVYLSAWARTTEMSRDDLDAALYRDRTLVKHMAMRRTLFVIDRGLFGVVQAAASDRVAAQESRRLIKDVEGAGLVRDGTVWLPKAQAATLAALEAGEATSTELRNQVELIQGSIEYAPDKSWGGKVAIAPRVLTTLSAAGLVVRASNRGAWSVSRPAWARTVDWLGHTPEAPPDDEARAELARRWLHTFGPATVGDLKWWLGDTLTATRAALSAIGAVPVDLHGSPGVALPDDLDTTDPVDPWAALLPCLDPTTMGWHQRDWYLGPHKSHLFDTNGNAGQTAWVDGRIVGGWTQQPDGEVVLQLLEPVTPDERRLLDAEAARLTDWFLGDRPQPRFPSPLSNAPGEPTADHPSG